MSSYSGTFRQLNVAEKCNILTQITPANINDMSNHTYYTWKRDADTEY